MQDRKSYLRLRLVSLKGRIYYYTTDDVAVCDSCFAVGVRLIEIGDLPYSGVLDFRR